MHTHHYTQVTGVQSRRLEPHLDAIAHDHQLRVLLKQHLSSRVSGDDRVVDEFQLAYGATRADVALVNGHLEGFEIKAGNDTLARLPRQVDAYTKIFEYSWVVTTKAHLAQVRELIPRTWGLMVADVDDTGSSLRAVRSAKRNPRRDSDHLARLLWRPELLAKLEELQLSKGLKTKPKVVLFAALAAALPVDELADYVRICLKARADWRADAKPRECGGSSHLDATP